MERLKIWLPMGVIGGVAVAALLLVKTFAPPPLSPEQPRASADTLVQPDARPAARSDAVIGSGTNRRGGPEVRYESDLLAVRADHARLESVMKEISRRAYVAIELDDDIAGDRITVEFAGLPLEEGLRRVLSGYDVFTYHRGGRGLLTVWVYGKLEGRGLMPVPADSWASTAELQRGLEDADPAARALALQSLVERGGTVGRQEAVRALDDEDEQVRTAALFGALNEDLDLPREKLTDLASNDSSHNVRFLALRNLAGHEGELEAAEAALNDPNPVVRSYAESVMLRLYPSEDSPRPEELQNLEP